MVLQLTGLISTPPSILFRESTHQKGQDEKQFVSMDMLTAYNCSQTNRFEIDSSSGLGELYVVFAMSKSVSKYIDSSGVDQAFIEANLYDPATHIYSYFLSITNTVNHSLQRHTS